MELVERAGDVLSSLADPTTWEHLKIKNSDYPQTGWMGSDSSTVIEVLHGFFSPLFAARALRYKAKRSRALLDKTQRLRLTLLRSALRVFLEEEDLASTSPVIPYTPRVPDWRQKRIEKPSQYWWQGLSPDRFRDARSIFLKTGTTEENENFEIVQISEFRNTYRRLYGNECPDKRQRQALGILGNGFYGFTPRSRPVLWRIIVCHGRLYEALLGNTVYDPATDSREDVREVFEPIDKSRFPFKKPPVEDEELFESFSKTIKAVDSYLHNFVVPKLESALTN